MFEADFERCTNCSNRGHALDIISLTARLAHLLLSSTYITMCPLSNLATTSHISSQPDLDLSSIVPQTPISQSAYSHAADVLDPIILNHSIRVYLYCKALAEHTTSKYITNPAKHDLLFTACLFHDIGTTSTYNGHERFEVEGADAAVKHLSQYNISEADKHDVWTSIAIHTSPGIAERIGELSRILRTALGTEFGRKTTDSDVLEPLREKLEGRFERANIEKVLGDAVVEQAKQKPDKAPRVSWPGLIYRAWLAGPEYEGVNKAF